MEKSLSKHTSWFQLINRAVISDQWAEMQILLQIIKVYQQWESKGMDESNSGWLNDYSLYSWKSASFLHKERGKKRKRTTWLTAESRGPLWRTNQLNSAKSLIMDKTEIFDSFWKICILYIKKLIKYKKISQLIKLKVLI